MSPKCRGNPSEISLSFSFPSPKNRVFFHMRHLPHSYFFSLLFMPTGSIKKKTDKGFGFITVEGSSDVFFHSSACQDSFDSLQEGDQVQFELGQGPKGPKAENVRRA